MASSLESDDNLQRKLRTSSRTVNMNLSYSETNSNSSEAGEFSPTKSQLKKREKASLKKNITEKFPHCDKLSSNDNSVDLTISDGKKLFPIFALSPPLRPHLNLSVNGKDEKKDPAANTIKSQEIPLLIDEIENMEKEDQSGNKIAKSQIKKINNAKKNFVSKVMEKSDKESVTKELFVKKQSTKIDKETDSDTLIANITAMKGNSIEQKVSVSAKKQQKINKNTDVSENINQSSDELSSPKVVAIKKQSITEFFKKIPNAQDTKVNEGISKLFPIFSHSPQRQNVISNIIPAAPKERVQKKRKFDEQLGDESVKQIKIHTEDVEAGTMVKSDNMFEKNVVEATSGVKQSFAKPENSSPVKKVRKISQKGKNRSFGAAVLRSCSFTSTCSTNSNDVLDDSLVNSEMFDGVVEKNPEKIRRRKLKSGVLKILPQSYKCLKKSKDKHTLRFTIKSVDKSSKLFPLFLKSPAALAKKKSIELVNSLAKKKAASVNSKQNKLSEGAAPDNLTEVVNKIKKKRGRPRRVQNSTPKKSSTETDEILEELTIEENESVAVSNNIVEKSKIIKRNVGRPQKVHSSTLNPIKRSTELKQIQGGMPIVESEKVSIPENVMDASKQFKIKAGRPRKVSGSVISPMKSSTELKQIQGGMPIEESEKVSIPENVMDASKQFKMKAGRPRKVKGSVISPMKSSVDFKELHKGLPVEKDGITSMCDKMNETSKKIKIKAGRPRKVLITILSPEKEEVFEKLPNKSAEVDVLSKNLTEGTENNIRKSLRLRSSASSMKKSLIDLEETIEELSNESIEEFNHQKKKNLKTFKGKKVTLAASGRKGQPPSKKQKIISPKKNFNGISGKSSDKLNFGKKISNETDGNTVNHKLQLNCERLSGKQNSTSTSKKTLTGAKEVVELSDESIEEIMEPSAVPKKGIQFETEINSNHSYPGVVDISKKVSLSLKKPEKCFSFPLYSHCGQIKISPETVINNALNYDIKKDTLDNIIPIPPWNNIFGLTDVKTIEPAALMDKLQVSMAHPFSSSSDEDGETLWTSIANDYNLKEGVSESTISELTSWLKQWKSKFTKSARHKRDKDDSFDSFSCDSYDSDGDGLSNSVILMGPPGSGKTSLVFSLANEHGFKVLEVNASSCRSGRNISHQLKEALESYHVENTKATDAKVVERKEINHSKAELRASKGTANKKPANKGIASFFQKEQSSPINATNENGVPIKNFFQPKSSTTKPKLQGKSKITDEKNSKTSSQNVDVPKDSSLCSISSQTIILFDDVDVVFQEDEGFWSTIRGFLKISKKPVIFTVGRNIEIVKANLDVDIQILHLKPMVSEIAIQKLQAQFQKRHRKNTNLNMELLAANSNDVRRNLLHAQFWSQPAKYQKIQLDESLLSTNTFFLGPSAADFKSLILDQPSSTTYKLISEYHKIGYDTLHANLFSLFGVGHDQEPERKWQMVTKRSEDLDNGDNDSKTETNSSQTDLWQEACKIFEFKKKALQNGSSSKDLFLFSNILEDFSFVDTLKGHYCKDTNWISLPERLKKWTGGLPMCNDNKLACPTDFTLDASSVIQVLTLKEEHKLYSQQSKPNQDNIAPLVLEHRFPNFDYIRGHNTEEHIEVISSAAPASLSINKSVLNLDYLSTLKIMGHDELLRQSRTGKRSNRFLHYFDSISLFLDKHQIEQILQG